MENKPSKCQNIEASKEYTIGQLEKLMPMSHNYLHKASHGDNPVLKFRVGTVGNTKTPCNYYKGSDVIAWRKAVDNGGGTKEAYVPQSLFDELAKQLEALKKSQSK